MKKCTHPKTMVKRDETGAAVGDVWCPDCLSVQDAHSDGKWHPAAGDKWRTRPTRWKKKTLHYRLRPTGMTDEHGRAIHILGVIYEDGKKNLQGYISDLRDFQSYRAGTYAKGYGIEATRTATDEAMDARLAAKKKRYGR